MKSLEKIPTLTQRKWVKCRWCGVPMHEGKKESFCGAECAMWHKEDIDEQEITGN